MTSYIARFKVDNSSLSSREKKLLHKLVEAAELIEPIYALQKNSKYKGSNFYPHDATYEEVKSAAEKDPSLLDMYTIVKRDTKGHLYSVPYHEEFKHLLKPVSEKLLEAASICDVDSFSHYLKIKSECLLNGNNKLADEVWVKTPQYKLDIVIGPMERYLDKLFFTKMAYQGGVQILEEELTLKAQKLKDALYATTKLFREFGIRRISSGDSVQVRYDNNVIYTGLISETMFVGEHLPSDTDVVKSSGSRIIVYLTSSERKFADKIYPLFIKCFDEIITRDFREPELLDGFIHSNLLHESVHQIHKYDGAISRLGDLYPVFDELNGEVSGIQMCRHLFMKGLITMRELESIILAHLGWCLATLVKEKGNTARSAYAQTCFLALSFYLSLGVIEIKNQKIRVKLDRIFFAIEDLADICIGMLKSGTKERAKEYINDITLKSLSTYLNKLS